MKGLRFFTLPVCPNHSLSPWLRTYGTTQISSSLIPRLSYTMLANGWFYHPFAVIDPFIPTMSSSLIFTPLANQNLSLAYTLFLTALCLLLFIPLVSSDNGGFSVYSETVADYWWRKQHNRTNLSHLNSCSWIQAGSGHTQWDCNIFLAHSCGHLDDYLALFPSPLLSSS